MCDRRSGPWRTPLVNEPRFEIGYDKRQLDRFLTRTLSGSGLRVDT